MFGPTLLLLTDVGTEVPHYRPRLRFAGNRDGQWKSHAVDHPRLIGSKVGLARKSRVPAVYLGLAFLLFFSVLAIPKISNLRSINHPEGFESHPRLQARCLCGFPRTSRSASARKGEVAQTFPIRQIYLFG